MVIKNNTGSPVEGSNFFGREKELKLAWEMLEDGNSLILAAPRRIGKTSFSKKMLEKAEDEGWTAIYIDLEGIQTEEAFVKRFTEDLINKNLFDRTFDKAKSFFDYVASSVKPTITAGGIEVSIEWKTQKNDIYEKLKETIRPEKETLIVIDELAIFLTYMLNGELKNISDVMFFLNWLRSLRQLKESKIRWIFCSSIGIENFLSIYSLSNTMNDVNSFPLDELKGNEPKELIQALCESKNIDISEEQIDYIIEKLGWTLPYFIQILFAEIYSSIRINDDAMSTNLIDKAYSNLINQKHFNTWDERLKEYSELEEPIRIILKRLCQIPEGARRPNLHTILNVKIENSDESDEVLSKILRILINDGYILEQDRIYGFRSPLLRDFWYNRYVQ